MTTTSTKLGLVVPGTSDVFTTSDIANNWNKVDSASGHYSTPNSNISTLIGSSGPLGFAWGANQTGNTVYDTTNNVTWVWTGSTLIRSGPFGALGSSPYNYPITSTVSFGTTATTIGTYAVTVPPNDIASSAQSRLLSVEAWIPAWTLTSGNLLAFLSCTNASSVAWTQSATATVNYHSTNGLYLKLIGTQLPGTLTVTLTAKGAAATSGGATGELLSAVSGSINGSTANPGWLSVTEL